MWSALQPPDEAGFWSQAGNHLTIKRAGMWLADEGLGPDDIDDLEVRDEVEEHVEPA